MKKYILLVTLFCASIANIYAQLNPDGSGACNGATSSTTVLRFGSVSGEGILSNRQVNSNGNQYGLDFFINSIVRMRMTNGGNIAIGNYATPTTRLSFGPHTQGTDQIMKLSVFDNSIRFGMGYFEEPNNTDFNRIYAFYASESRSRFGFFDNYSGTGLTTSSNGTEFVTFKLSNRSVGIGNINPEAYLHVRNTSITSAPVAIFESGQNSTNLTARLIITNNSGAGAKNYIDGYSYTPSTSTQTNAPIYFQSNSSGGTVGIGNFPYASSTGYFAPSSLLHIQYGNLQVTNSGAPVLNTLKSGITMGAVGTSTATPASDYSWIQSSSGPLLLNPLSPNTLAGSQSQNFVCIGIAKASIPATVPNGYNLLVQGKIMCEELKIKLIGGWYDHVFASDYKLMSVDSLQSYISLNHHLPDVPSAKEVEENGVMAGEMSGILLKKVEELTLYMIEQNKNISNQEAQIELLKKQNELLMQQVQLLVSKGQETTISK
jgi:hypothetical protein